MKVIKLKTRETITCRSNPALVAMCKDLLQWAESGELQSLVVVGQDADGRVVDGWAKGLFSQPYVLLGAIEKLKIEFAEKEIESR